MQPSQIALSIDGVERQFQEFEGRVLQLLALTFAGDTEAIRRATERFVVE